MFSDFRRAWREAVDNFWRELEGDPAVAEEEGAYREVARARAELERLDSEIAESVRRLDGEREQVSVCARRERLAREIGDTETATIAAEYGRRHLERAQVLERKLDALRAERDLCRRDLGEMERALGRASAGRSDSMEDAIDLDRHPLEREFRDLEEDGRARSAEERLEEMKRRMGR